MQESFARSGPSVVILGQLMPQDCRQQSSAARLRFCSTASKTDQCPVVATRTVEPIRAHLCGRSKSGSHSRFLAIMPPKKSISTAVENGLFKIRRIEPWVIATLEQLSVVVSVSLRNSSKVINARRPLDAQHVPASLLLPQSTRHQVARLERHVLPVGTHLRSQPSGAVHFIRSDYCRCVLESIQNWRWLKSFRHQSLSTLKHGVEVM